MALLCMEHSKMYTESFYNFFNLINLKRLNAGFMIWDFHIAPKSATSYS